jgi:transposase-like protein
MMQERGVEVDHSTINRWVLKYAPELDKRIRPHLLAMNDSWRVDETYIKVKGQWKYLYRAVDSQGNTLDFLLSAKRDATAAQRFLRKTLNAPHTQMPRVINVDKNAAYPPALARLTADEQLPQTTKLRQVKYLNNVSSTNLKLPKRKLRLNFKIYTQSLSYGHHRIAPRCDRDFL